MKSPLLNLFSIERKVDECIIDLTEDTPNLSINETFYDCEMWVNYENERKVEREYTVICL